MKDTDPATEAWLRQLARALAAAVVAIPPAVRAERAAGRRPTGLSAAERGAHDR